MYAVSFLMKGLFASGLEGFRLALILEPEAHALETRLALSIHFPTPNLTGLSFNDAWVMRPLLISLTVGLLLLEWIASFTVRFESNMSMGLCLLISNCAGIHDEDAYKGSWVFVDLVPRAVLEAFSVAASPPNAG